jgi:ribosomal protein L13E
VDPRPHRRGRGRRGAGFRRDALTELAHDAALLGINVDTGRLFDCADDYPLFIEALVSRVAETREQIARQAK